MSITYSINWNAQISSVGGVPVLGVAVVYNGTAFIPATTANFASYPLVRGIIVTTPQPVSTGYTAELAVGGPVPASITGLSASATGSAVLNSSGFVTVVPVAGPSDIYVGEVDQGLLRLNLPGASTSSAGGIPWISLSDPQFGAVGGGTGDDTAAVQACVDVSGAGDRILVSSTHVIKKPIKVWHSEEHVNLSFVGANDAYQAGLGQCGFIWEGADRTGSAASLTKLYRGTSYVATIDIYEYLQVTGLSGLLSTDVGRQLLIGNAARSYWNVVGIIERVVSATECVVAIPVNTTNVSIVGNTDANNGSITWAIWQPMFECLSREITFIGLTFSVRGAGNRCSAFADFSESTDPTAGLGAGVATHFMFQNCCFYSNIAGGAGAIYQLGRDILPDVGSTNYKLEGGYRRPWSPYQNDYVVMRDCVSSSNVTDGIDCTVWTGNISGQQRQCVFDNCSFSNQKWVDHAYSRFTNAAEYLYSSASFSADRSYMAWSAISQCVFLHGNPNSHNTLRASYCEGIVAQLAYSRVAGAAFRPFEISDCLFNMSGVVAGGKWLEWTNGPISFTDCTFLPASGSLAGFHFELLGNPDGSMTFTRCVLPAEAETGGVLFTFDGSSTRGMVSRVGCWEWNVGASSLKPVTDRITQLGYTTEGGKSLQAVRGLSGTYVENANFIGTATVTGAATTAVWTFGTAETSATKLYGWAVPISSTGGPAAGSNRVLTCVVTTTTATVTVEVAPGVGNSVTFAILLARGL